MTSPFEPVELTEDELAVQQANTLLDYSKLTLDELKIKLKNQMGMLWENQKVSPAKMWEKLGTRGGALLNAHYQTQLLIKTHLDPDYVILTTPVPVIVGNDGTVTLGEAQ